MKLLDYVSQTANFQDVPQCAWLNISIDYYKAGWNGVVTVS